MDYVLDNVLIFLVREYLGLCFSFFVFRVWLCASFLGGGGAGLEVGIH